jgi:hypothetical protein
LQPGVLSTFALVAVGTLMAPVGWTIGQKDGQSSIAGAKSDVEHVRAGTG